MGLMHPHITLGQHQHCGNSLQQRADCSVHKGALEPMICVHIPKERMRIEEFTGY